MMLLSDFSVPFPGVFRKCLKIPVLQSGKAEKYADILMNRLDREKSIDIDSVPEKRDPAFSTDYLFSDARGQMFGILLCINRKGETVILKAFSGQYNGRWTVQGWVPPVIDPDDFDRIVCEKDKEIKKLDMEIENLKSVFNTDAGVNHTDRTYTEAEKGNLSADNSAELSSNSGHTAEETEEAVFERIKDLKDKRKQISQNLMKEIHSLYYLHNFAGEKKEMGTVFKKEDSRTAGASPEHEWKKIKAVSAMPADKKEAPSASEEACGTPVQEGTPVPLGANMPSGTGDCCAPKLLNYAAKEKLIPLSLIEFYYGKENRSGSRIHRHFYPPCADKCGPIMEYMLTGIKELHKKYSSLIKSADL